jgi:HD-GYP domain-containing protein (c-di-GMP phosphodiesterase class II)
MDSLKDIAGQPRALTDSELKLIRGHISKSLETVERIANINYTVKQTIRMHHERVSGNGYPSGIFTDDINPYARILGLVDTYEAMTHNRPHREGMNSHKAVRFLIGSLKGDFDSDVLKIFINKMSVYPIGSTVMLDTGEMAKVISVQPGSPLRPVVMILRGANGENITERTIIDLSKQDVPSIKSSVSP